MMTRLLRWLIFFRRPSKSERWLEYQEDRLLSAATKGMEEIERELTLNRRGNMELWQAILLGAQIREKGSLFFYNSVKKTSCALGAGIEAVVGTQKFTSPGFSFRVEITRHWPWAEKTFAICPACGQTDYIVSIIPHLNNSGGISHDWTRERIALEFVKPIEEALEQKPVAPIEEVKEMKC